MLESIDQKLDKVNIAPIPADDTPELMTVKDLGRYLPSHPKPSTVYGWVNDNTIPHYKSGQTALFRRQGIEAWIERAQRYGNGDFWTKKRQKTDYPRDKTKTVSDKCRMFKPKSALPSNNLIPLFPNNNYLVLVFHFNKNIP